MVPWTQEEMKASAARIQRGESTMEKERARYMARLDAWHERESIKHWSYGVAWALGAVVLALVCHLAALVLGFKGSLP
jgi:hypothetical protein